jgi:hypothetical protein
MNMGGLNDRGKTIYGLKISPFIMFLMKPKNISAGGSLINKILDLQNNLTSCVPVYMPTVKEEVDIRQKKTFTILSKVFTNF